MHAQVATYRSGRLGAAVAAAGVLLSGPLAVLAVEVTHPQPAWEGPARFAASYHPMQALPYAGGLVLVGGLLLWAGSLAVLAAPERPVRAVLSMLAAAAFGALIVLNYAIQTTYVPVLARAFQPADGPLLSALTMANPTSLAWAIEMWGWGLFGVCTWLLAPGCGGADALARLTARLCVVNGVVSLLGTAATAGAAGWVMGSVGLWAFSGWNLLLFVLTVLSFVSLGRRARAR